MVVRRHQPPTEQFVEEFQRTAVPSSIPSSEFINWNKIESEIENYKPQIEAILRLEDSDKNKFVEGLTDVLMEVEDTRRYIDFYFELLGERGNKYSAKEGVWKFYGVQRKIDSGDREAALEIAEVLQKIGLQEIVEEADVEDHYRGMLVGMETHARKNRQGKCFENLVEQKLEYIVEQAQDHDIEIKKEHTVEYEDQSGQQKTVDFALVEEGELQVVVEANAYKSGGSKPSEIRRSYNYVAQRMRNDGVGFVWITDGQGWKKSLENVLRESYEDIKDIYNLHQAEKHLPRDVISFLENEEET
jgi:phenolic acid decarboxylase